MLSNDHRSQLRAFLKEKPWKDFYKYGGGRGIKPCKRITRTYYKPDNPLNNHFGATLKAYQASYMYETNSIPSENEKISHSCANPENLKETLCIEITHMELESQQINMERRRHHYIIREYEKKNRYKGKREKGPLFITEIPIEFLCKHLERIGKKSEITVDMEVIRRQNGNCTCDHNPTCFINYKRDKKKGTH